MWRVAAQQMLFKRTAATAAITAPWASTGVQSIGFSSLIRPLSSAWSPITPAGSSAFSTSATVQSPFAVNPKRKTARLKAKLKAKQKRLRRNKTKGPWK